jgi:hypothetical protein
MPNPKLLLSRTKQTIERELRSGDVCMPATLSAASKAGRNARQGFPGQALKRR